MILLGDLGLIVPCMFYIQFHVICLLKDPMGTTRVQKSENELVDRADTSYSPPHFKTMEKTCTGHGKGTWKLDGINI